MPAIKSLDELKRIREEALQKKQMKATPGNVQVIVAMGTCVFRLDGAIDCRFGIDHNEGQDIRYSHVRECGDFHFLLKVISDQRFGQVLD